MFLVALMSHPLVFSMRLKDSIKMAEHPGKVPVQYSRFQFFHQGFTESFLRNSGIYCFTAFLISFDYTCSLRHPGSRKPLSSESAAQQRAVLKTRVKTARQNGTDGLNGLNIGGSE